jgi:L-fuconolactonase
VIDAHQHFWQTGKNDCTWPTPDLVAIHRDFEPRDLEALATPLGVTGSVLVQSQPSDIDTDWLLGVARDTPFVEAVVGWADLEASGAPERIAALAARPKMRGLRPMLQNLPDDVWILAAGLDPAIRAMIAHGLSFDALVFTRHLPHLAVFARRYPQLAIVIDHAAKPPIAARSLDPWRKEIARLAALPNVSCKLSGLLNEAAPSDGGDALAPYVRHLVEVFGPSRLMWGSDWPVLNLAGDYKSWLAMANELSGLNEAGLAALFGATASSFYRLHGCSDNFS